VLQRASRGSVRVVATIRSLTATASATNAASVNDPGKITCQTPVLVIAKTPDTATVTAGEPPTEVACDAP